MAARQEWTLADLSDEVKGLSQEKFLVRFRSPFLLLQRFGIVGGVGLATVLPEETVKQSHPSDPETGDYDPGKDRVVLVEKSSRNAIEGTITLGRSVSSDIIVLHPSVSKVHALFKHDKNRVDYTVTDPGSTNGTELGGEPLDLNVPRRIRNGQVLTLGGTVKATFLYPKPMFDFLQGFRSLRGG